MKTISHPKQTEDFGICNNCHKGMEKDSFGLPLFRQLPYNGTPVCKSCYEVLN